MTAFVPPIPPNPPAPAKAPGLFRQTPPAIFPPVLGVLGLGLAWRAAAEKTGLPAAPAEVILGAGCLLWAFVALAYLAKMARRPSVAADDLRVLPGQTGLAGATMGLMAVALALAPVAPALAMGAALAGLAAHLPLATLMATRFARAFATARAGGPAAAPVSPAWHMLFVGPVVGILAVARLGHAEAALALMWLVAVPAVAIWAVSLRDMLRALPPAPLRPMLAIHAAPAGLLALLCLEVGLPLLAPVFALVALLVLLGLALRAGWTISAGFTPLWSGFTFPMAAGSAAFLELGGPWLAPGIAALIGATLLTPYVATRVLRGWAQGWLAAKTGTVSA